MGVVHVLEVSVCSSPYSVFILTLQLPMQFDMQHTMVRGYKELSDHADGDQCTDDLKGTMLFDLDIWVQWRFVRLGPCCCCAEHMSSFFPASTSIFSAVLPCICVMSYFLAEALLPFVCIPMSSSSLFSGGFTRHALQI